MFLSLLTTLAQSNFDSSSGEVPAGIAAGLGIFMIVIWLIIIVFGIFTLWMLIDAIIRKEEDYQAAGAGSKILWIVLILFLGFIPAIVYFFLVRKKVKKAQNQTAPVSAPPTQTETPPTQPEVPKEEPKQEELE